LYIIALSLKGIEARLFFRVSVLVPFLKTLVDALELVFWNIDSSALTTESHVYWSASPSKGEAGAPLSKSKVVTVGATSSHQLVTSFQ
jgi:hypothetical protein